MDLQGYDPKEIGRLLRRALLLGAVAVPLAIGLAFLVGVLL